MSDNRKVMNTGPDVLEVVTGKRFRVLLAGDFRLVLDMLHDLLEPEFEVVGIAYIAEFLLHLADSIQPDIALINVTIPGRYGRELGRELRARVPATKLVYLTVETDEALAAEAFSFGASGYVLKTSSAAELRHAMRVVAHGGSYLTPVIANGDIDALREAHRLNPIDQLTSREMEVVRLLVCGRTMKAVARQLGIAPRTVAFHKYRAMEALSLRSNEELIEFAIRHGLLGDSK